MSTPVSNSASKNETAPCAEALSAGVAQVSLVPAGIRRCCGDIAFWATVFSVVPGDWVVVFQTRPRVTVVPVTAGTRIWLRWDGGVGVAAGGTVPPSLNAHRWSPLGMSG